MFTVGLTGGIGSGKSLVSRTFEDLGVEIIDADIVARQVVDLGSSALQQIIQRFGPEITLPDGTLNRALVREAIFQDPAKKIWLEELLHPLIRQQIITQLELATSTYGMLVSPLLLETHQDVMVQRILVVDVPADVQYERALRRDGSQPEIIKAIMANQLTRQQRLARADDTIDNSGSERETVAQVERLHARYLELAAQM